MSINKDILFAIADGNMRDMRENFKKAMKEKILVKVMEQKADVSINFFNGNVGQEVANRLKESAANSEMVAIIEADDSDMEEGVGIDSEKLDKMQNKTLMRAVRGKDDSWSDNKRNTRKAKYEIINGKKYIVSDYDASADGEELQEEMSDAQISSEIEKAEKLAKKMGKKVTVWDEMDGYNIGLRPAGKPQDYQLIWNIPSTLVDLRMKGKFKDTKRGLANALRLWA